MANERVSMRNAREVPRQKFELGRSHREVAVSIGRNAGTVGALLARARAAGLVDRATVNALDEATLDKKLYGPAAAAEDGRPEPDCEWISRERDDVSAALRVLGEVPGGYQYGILYALRRAAKVTRRHDAAASCCRRQNVCRLLGQPVTGRRPGIGVKSTRKLVGAAVSGVNQFYCGLPFAGEGLGVVDVTAIGRNGSALCGSHA